MSGNTTNNPGVAIGEAAMIGSGSVATKDAPNNAVAVGAPCRVIGEMMDNDKAFCAKKAEAYDCYVL